MKQIRFFQAAVQTFDIPYAEIEQSVVLGSNFSDCNMGLKTESILPPVSPGHKNREVRPPETP